MQKIMGTHLIVDGYVEDVDTLSNENIFELCNSLVEALGMKYLLKPQALQVPMNPEKLESSEDEGGWSFFCLITTSHIALHTFPLKKAVMIDIFSCVHFDTDVANNLLAKYLKFRQHRSTVVDRLDPDHREDDSYPSQKVVYR